MVTITRTITINRPHKDVFSYVSDYRNDPNWRNGVLAMKQEPEADVKVGTKTYETIKFMGRTLTVVAAVTDYKKNDAVYFQTITAPIKSEGFRKVTPKANTTELTYSLSADLNGFYKMFSSSIAKQFSKRVEQDLRKLKDILENKSS